MTYKNIWFPFFMAAGIILGCFTVVSAQPVPLPVTVHKIKDPGDTVRVLLWKGASGFPRDKNQAFRKGSVQANDSVVTLVFENVPPGEYAVSCFYDENNNRRYDRSWFYRTAEPFGLSGRPDYKHLPVQYQDARFSVHFTGDTVHIWLHYTDEAEHLFGW